MGLHFAGMAAIGEIDNAHAERRAGGGGCQAGGRGDCAQGARHHRFKSRECDACAYTLQESAAGDG